MTDPDRHRWVATHVLPHEREVRAWLRRHVHRLTPPDIDDLIQETYARLWLVDYQNIHHPRSYLFTVVRSLLIEQARRARIVPMERMGEIDALRIPSEEPGPDRRAASHQELERLLRIVEQLPEQCRRAFQLQKFQGLSLRAIADQMNITEKTVEKHLALALARVLDALKADTDSASPRPQPGNSGHGTEHSRD